MGRRRKKDSNEAEKGAISLGSFTSKETRNAIIGVFALALALFLLLGAFAMAGRAGEFSFSNLSMLFGIGYYLLPLVLMLMALSFFRSRESSMALPQLLGSLLLFLSGLGIVSLVASGRGGVLGNLLAKPLLNLFDLYASIIILVALLVAAILVIFDSAIKIDVARLWNKLFGKEEIPDELEEVEAQAVSKAVEKIAAVEDKEAPIATPKPAKLTGEEGFMSAILRRSSKAWTPPPLSLLEKDRGKPGVGDIKANANLIKRTLMNFGIVVEMDEISIGPTVTRYAMKPAEGVKLSKILGLQNNLELALAAHPVRIEAPIPGKSLVGIEVPNTAKSTIGLGSLIGEEAFSNSEKPLYVALGKDITGSSIFSDIAKMPHLLVAGATGSGKSVTIHTVITSLLYRNPPDNLKFIMIDPKRVELTLYNGIPHLLTPVITEPKKAILSLKWLGKEMERRYDLLEKASVRDIGSYHKNVYFPELEKNKGKEGAELPDPIPYIVVIIDELADLMQTYPRELEAAIVRLAQMSRAVGIHLLLSTQRPSVNVITGLIKANIPSRIALQVASQIDSRTILDSAGAEKLLGAGDMLFQSADMSKPVRIQSAFITEPEVKSVAKHLKDAYADELTQEINFTTENTSNSIFSASTEDGDGFDGDDDELYEEAKATVLGAGKASTSFLQRKLRIGYARAARLIDLLEERGVVSPGSGAKPREVIGATGGAGGESSFGPEDDPENFGADES